MLTEKQARKWGAAKGFEVWVCSGSREGVPCGGCGELMYVRPDGSGGMVPDYHEGGDALWEWVDALQVEMRRGWSDGMTTEDEPRYFAIIGALQTTRNFDSAKAAAIAAIDRWCEQ